MAIEVTTSLKAGKLRADADKIHKLKELAGDADVQTRRPAGFIFGYRSAPLDRLLRVIDQHEEERPPSLRVDTITSLEHGFLTNVKHEQSQVTLSPRALPGFTRVPFTLETVGRV